MRDEPTVSEHAIDRYMERTGVKSRERARNKILLRWNAARSIGGGEWYARGWIICMRADVITTITKPHKEHSQERIYASRQPLSTPASRRAVP